MTEASEPQPKSSPAADSPASTAVAAVDPAAGQGNDAAPPTPQPEHQPNAVVLPDQPPAVPDCLNCGHPVALLYCPNCGQSLRDVRVSISSLVMDFLGDAFTFDSKLFRSMRPLFLKPGFLTREFMRGRRAQYIPPLRMYLFFSILFFLTINLTRDSNIDPHADAPAAKALMIVTGYEELPSDLRKTNANQAAVMVEQQAHAEFNQTRAALGLNPIELGTDPNILAEQETEPEANEAAETYEIAFERYEERMERVAALRDGTFKLNSHIRITRGFEKSEDAWKKWLEDKVDDQVARLKHMDPDTFYATLIDTFFKLLPNVMFVLMPLFAFFLKVVYLRRDPLYIDHLITAFHFHAFVFCFLSLVILGLAVFDNLVLNVFGLLGALGAIHLYLYLMLKCIYGQSHLKTLLKFILLWLIYGMTLNLAMGTALISSIFMI
ncbi:DUF3667 domain-containing protein [Acanthopleuribacter pedis]|uniref:DUF3667 domain-containing protein n=1 Tax=Acanthopleuribacter pedis TaxID=442870 RepID=A0A8J7U557_9BACT|nr:DUF3667 domain-containing protein [Acanthopleuribacter pedis]MBO1318981.1 DUF3667 domain-containing protein [Acanthopleuribacter pedis]